MGSAMHRAVKRPHKLVLLWWVSLSASTPLRGTGARPPWEKKNLPPQRGLRSLSPDYDFETVSMDRDVISVVLPGNTVFFSYAARSRSFHLLYLLCSSSREVGLHLPRAAAPLCSFRGGSGRPYPTRRGSSTPAQPLHRSFWGFAPSYTFAWAFASSELLRTAMCGLTQAPGASPKHLGLPRQIFS